MRWILVALVSLAIVGCGPIRPSDPAQAVVYDDIAKEFGSNPFKLKRWYPVVKRGKQSVVRVELEGYVLATWIQFDKTYTVDGGKVVERVHTKNLKQSPDPPNRDR